MPIPERGLGPFEAVTRLSPCAGTHGLRHPIHATRTQAEIRYATSALSLEKTVMDVTVLIDAIVRQTTVLIAQLATAAGGRAPLVNTANKVFVDLVRELKAQGLGNKVIADMFGLALRTYHDKVRRLSESTTVRGQSLWEAVFKYIEERGPVLQADVLDQFRSDDEATTRGVLADLVGSGMVFRTGRGAQTTFRVARPEEVQVGARHGQGDANAHLVWVAVSRLGSASPETIAEMVPLERPAIDVALARLVDDGRVARVERAKTVEYRTDLCFIPFGTPAGWEAAVFDHYQAVVTAICTKLRMGATAAKATDHVGGSTFGFKVWNGHPHRDEVLGLLRRIRLEVGALREKVTAYNAEHPSAEDSFRVISYMGQTVVRDVDPEEE